VGRTFQECLKMSVVLPLSLTESKIVLTNTWKFLVEISNLPIPVCYPEQLAQKSQESLAGNPNRPVKIRELTT